MNQDDGRGKAPELRLGDLPEKPRPTSLASRSDDQVANHIIGSMLGMGDCWRYDEGNFYWWSGRYWRLVSRDVFKEYFVAPFEGCAIKGTDKRFEVNYMKADKVIKTVCEKVVLEHRRFFSDAKLGVNCENGFVEFDDKTGDFKLVKHEAEQRQRHLLRGKFVPLDRGLPFELPSGSRLSKFFGTMFCDDPEGELKVRIIQEVMGAAITGYGVKLRQPKALVLWGPGNNGKSQLGDLLIFLVPDDAHSSVSPHMFWKENEAIKLVGKLLNVTSELRSNGIASDLFKAAVTGDSMVGRLLYKDSVEFRPVAQHVFSTNKLPKFRGGFDSAVKRRLMVIKCDRVIPEREMIEQIAQVIRDEEYSLLISFAVEGAHRLIRSGRFTDLPSSNEIIADWIRDNDPVGAWMEECVVADPDNNVGYVPKVVLGAFRQYARENFYDPDDYKDLRVESFRERMARDFPSVKRSGGTKRFRGIRILGLEQQQGGGRQPQSPLELLKEPMRKWPN